jgi:hypothetical protein
MPKISTEYELLKKLTVPQLKNFCKDQDIRVTFKSKTDALPRIVQAVKRRKIGTRKLINIVINYQKVVMETESEKIKETTTREITRHKKRVSVTKVKIRARGRTQTKIARKTIRLLKKYLRASMLRKPKDEKEIEQNARGILVSHKIPVTDQVGTLEYMGKKYVPDMVIEQEKKKIVIEIKRVNSKRDVERATAQAFAYASKYPETIIVLYDVRGVVEKIPKSQKDELGKKGIYLLSIKH